MQNAGTLLEPKRNYSIIYYIKFPPNFQGHNEYIAIGGYLRGAYGVKES